jgi:CheY-like chemotaxis protein
MRGVSVLVVEDDSDIREALQEAIEFFQYTCEGVGNGQEALDYLAKNPAPQMIILDLMMPTMNGYQFRTQQLLDPKIANIPVVVISADGRIMEKFRKVGVNAGISKPISMDQLESVIDRFCKN